MYRDIPEELRVLIEPVVSDAGFELVDAMLTRGRAPWLLRVTIDTPEGDGRVPVDRCAGVSREIGSQLEAADSIPVAYRRMTSAMSRRTASSMPGPLIVNPSHAVPYQASAGITRLSSK